MRAALLACVVVLAVVGEALKIGSLPGAPSVSYNQYAGYLDVGSGGRHMFYWFLESQSNPATDPVLLWLTGGPGCSGLSALLTEWGPLQVNPDGTTLRVNQYGWNANANVLVVEAPIGVGFSYSDDGSTSTSDNQTASENWDALKSFFTAYPQYANNDFYVTGESYGGIYVPTLVGTILNRQSQFKINLKGFAIGNGCVDGDEGLSGVIQYQFHHGFSDTASWFQASTQCCAGKIDGCDWGQAQNVNSFCSGYVSQEANAAWYSGMNPYNYLNDCYPSASMPRKDSRRFMKDLARRTKGKAAPPPLVLDSPICMNENPVINYLNQPAVRQALGVPSSVQPWDICSDIDYQETTDTTKPYFLQAQAAGLRALLYYGDVDMACNFLGGQRFSRKLGFKLNTAAKSYKVDGQVGGFYTQYQGLGFATIRGAGHLVPTDKPNVALHLLQSFLANKHP